MHLDLGLDDLEAIVHLAEGAHVGNRLLALAQVDARDGVGVEGRRGRIVEIGVRDVGGRVVGGADDEAVLAAAAQGGAVRRPETELAATGAPDPQEQGIIGGRHQAVADHDADLDANDGRPDGLLFRHSNLLGDPSGTPGEPLQG